MPHSRPSRQRKQATASVKGFGCRPEHERSIRYKAGVRKPPRKEPAGRRVDGCRLWGFDGAAAWVGDAFAGVVGGSDDRGSEFAAAAAVGGAILAWSTMQQVPWQAPRRQQGNAESEAPGQARAG
jgi:hypothetical protein